MKNEPKDKHEYIIGIGASAGGLEALQKLLTALSPTTGFPYIIIQHLSPDYKSLLGEILGKYTEMPVYQAEDGMKIEANTVYVIQPGKIMRLHEGKLQLTDQVPKELNLPIDMFFRSLAEEAGSRAIAIVLSGTGSDGTSGIKAIKESEGMVIVQDPDTSKFDGMPRSAIRTGIVDAQLSPEQIAAVLQHFSSSCIEPAHAPTEDVIDAEIMRKVYAILKKVSNVNFTHYKQTTIIRRMERRMMLTHKDKFSEYVDYLYESPEEVRILSKEVLIGVTSFFRDPDFFQTLKDKAITEIITRSLGDEPIRVWVAGCSTGEEAYSIAIMFSEVMDATKIKREVKIFATDLDVEAINTAGKGIYGDSIADAVSPARLSKYFTKKNNTYVINREIRKMIVFSPHNVFQDPPFGRLDLISCRNMLIYFQPVLQSDLFSIFHAALKDSGFLFLGKSEAIGSYTEAFPVVDAAAKIFAHRSEAKIPGAKKVPFLQTTYLGDEYAVEADMGFSRAVRFNDDGVKEGASIDTSILEKLLPACLVINEKNELVHSFGEVSNFVHMPSGKFTNNLFDVLAEDLKIPVSTLLRESRQKKRKVKYRDIIIEGEREKGIIDLAVMPVGRGNGESDGLYAIVFTETAKRSEDDESVPYEIDRVASQRITDLEQELSEVQGKLDKSVAEQECVNEELQAANEELLTANEELQSSNEELQSVNEELYTVNTEYQQKLTELADLNDDIANFLSSTLTGIIFVDNKLSIRRYTDYVTSEFSVMDHDIGRSLAFISYHFPKVDITEICTNVLKTLIPDEREVTTNNDKIFFMRVAPYRSTENKILGCVITLMDVTSQKQGQAILQSTEKQLSMAQQASEAKSDYLSRLANDIRAPMNAVVNDLKKAKEQAAAYPELLENINNIHETVARMTEIVTDISEASISEQLAGARKYEPFSLQSVVDYVSGAIQPCAIEAGIEFITSIDDKPGTLYSGSKLKLEQVLISFLNNSLTMLKSGESVSLRVFEKSRRGDKSNLCFVISDNGETMKKEQRERLFKPFADADGENTLPIVAGLGLSVAYNMIMSMGGDVFTENEKARGNTFTIHIPLDRYNGSRQEAVAYDGAEETAIDLSGCHVLVAEDNTLNRRILCAQLSSEGMTYVETEDGEEACKTFIDSPEGTFDCILMDMRMPKLDGIRATQKIRDSGKSDSKTIPIIGVSANGYADDIKQARAAGIDEYTTKPIERDTLFSIMSKLIERHNK